MQESGGEESNLPGAGVTRVGASRQLVHEDGDKGAGGGAGAVGDAGDGAGEGGRHVENVEEGGRLEAVEAEAWNTVVLFLTFSESSTVISFLLISGSKPQHVPLSSVTANTKSIVPLINHSWTSLDKVVHK